ncbi:MAG: hypothetical protein AB1630_10875 [bacterium]
MKKLIFVLFLIVCGGCYKFFLNPYDAVMWPSGRYYVNYNFIIQAPEGASDITLYLPFPHYKGKPDMKILRWLKETLASALNNAEYYYNESIKDYKNHCKRNKVWYKEHGLSDEEYKRAMKQFYEEKVSPEEEKIKYYSNFKIDLIDTEYGKMLYIYIPQLLKKEETENIRFSSNTKADSSRPIKINPKTVIEDYKLTYEDKIVPEKPEPGVDIPKDWIGYGGERCEKLNLPFYVQFKGNELKVSFGYSISEETHHGGSIALLSYEAPPRLKWLKGDYGFTKSGWHWVPVIK